MNDMYTVRTFRENLREAFNKAEAGKDVYIERYGKTYMLTQDKPFNTLDEQMGGRITAYADKHRKEFESNVVTVDDPTYTDPEEAA